MKCPDCGQKLAEVSVSGFDKSFRCENCGGFLLAGWVANRVAEGQMRELPTVKTEIDKFLGKTNLCPVDGSPLFGYSGEDMPPEVPVLKCSHCGEWWFPGDALYKFKSAYEAKNSYEKLWRKRAPMMVMTLPVLMVTVLMVTLGYIVNNINKPVQTVMQASAGGHEFNAQYLGEGRALVRFKSEDIGFVWLKSIQSDIWNPVEVYMTGNGWYRIRLSNLNANEVYQIKISESIYYFKTQ